MSSYIILTNNYSTKVIGKALILHVKNQLYGTIKNVSNGKNKRDFHKLCEQTGFSQ